MAFWGAEVTPGEPYILQPSPDGRLRITQALLGSHADVGWSILECNVGNMDPVRICALNPTNHICDLEIEYEEIESVFLSVSGSSSIHLSGKIYKHSASDDQAHTSNKLASKTKSPACLKRNHQGNEANENKAPSLKEPTAAKADGKNDASSKEPPISEADGKNVASPKQPIVGEVDYSDDHVPILVAYKKRKYRTPGIRKVLSGQNNDYKIMESSVVQTVPIQDHKITQEEIITKADGKNQASLEEPKIIEASGKNAASPKQHIVSEHDHLPFRTAHKKRMPTRKRKNRTPGIGKMLSGQNDDYAIMESSVAHTVPIQYHQITQDIVTKAVDKNEASPEEPIISKASVKGAPFAEQHILDEDDDNDGHLPVLVAHKKRKDTKKRKHKSPEMGKVSSDHNNDHNVMDSSVAHTVPIQDHEITQDIVTKADGKNEDSPEEPIISEASGKSAASAKQPIVGNEANGNKEPSLKVSTVTQADGKNDASSKEPLISEAGGKNDTSPKQPIVDEDDYSDDHVPILVAYKKRMATRKDSNVMHTMPTQGHEVTQDNISQLVGATSQSTRDDGFLFTGATNQHESVSVQELYMGDGKYTASDGSKVTVEYVGKLLDGQIVDPMGIRKFRLGAGEVIPGWDAGVSGMRVGSKRKVIIPPALGHGNQAVGMIPANSCLVYEFELKKVRRTKKASKVSKNPS